jgi:hypothetical protein
MLWAALLGAIGLYAWSRTPQGAAMVAKAVDVTASGIRGIRNNNPGNIERTATRWKGMLEDQSGDPRFIVFADPVWGLRALARVLRTYMSNGFNTPRMIVNRWAPPAENDTGAYVNAVAARAGLSPDQMVDEFNLPQLIDAIVQHENGRQPYSLALIDEAIRLERIA